jgi:hypothetical protein
MPKSRQSTGTRQQSLLGRQKKLALDFRRRAISKRALYATAANSVFNLTAKTATMDAGYGEVLDSNHNPPSVVPEQNAR